MIISSSIKLTPRGEPGLTPALVRGLFLIWQSELKRGHQFAEIREFDSYTRVVGSFTGRTFGVPEDNPGYETRIDFGSWEPALPDTASW